MSLTLESTYPRFAALVKLPEETLRLAEAALLLALDEYPNLDVKRYLRALDQYGEEVQATLPASAGTSEVLAHVSQYLFEGHGFAGNQANFYDPRNSFLNDVLDRKLGIPITLSVVYLEVAWRLGVNMAGVSLPGRFMVGCFEPPEPVVIDPFGGGAELARHEVQELLARMYGPSLPDGVELESLLVPASKKDILIRMLRNLKAIYVTTRDFGKALPVLDRMLLLEPDAPTELRDRGFVLHQLDCVDAARADWSRYLALVPDAPDGAEVREWLENLAPSSGRLN